MDHSEGCSTASLNAFSLLELPYVPLLRILKNLDEKSLRKVLLTCSPLFSFIKKNRIRMVSTKIHAVSFRRLKDQMSDEVFVEVKIRKTENSPEFSLHCSDNSVVQEEVKNTYSMDFNVQKIFPERTFLEWISTHFVNIEIDRIYINQFFFIHSSSEEICHLERAVRRNNIQVTNVFVRNCLRITHMEINDLLSFPMAFGPKRLLITEEKCAGTPLLMTPSTLNNLPSTFVMGSGILLLLPKFKSAIEKWAENRVTVLWWSVNISFESDDIEKFFLEEIDLPCVSEKNGRFRIAGSAERALIVISSYRREDKYWTIKLCEISNVAKRID